jgi:uncharacterized protein YndB with AHSA1/START domain
MDTFVIEKTLQLDAPAKKVFDALTRDINKWWSRDFLIGGDNAKKLVCEPKLGGKMYEVWGAGEGSTWGTVTEIKKGARLEICGTIGNMGATWCKVGYDFEQAGKSTTVTFTHHAIGNFEEGTREEFAGGWDQLFTELKTFVEKKKKK